LREAVGLILPREAAERPKLGFPVPLGHWFRGELAGFPEHVLRAARTEEWLDKRAVLDVARRFRRGDPDVSWRQIWALVVFSLWHQIFMERLFDPVKLGWVGGAGPDGGGGRPSLPSAERAQRPAQPPAQPSAERGLPAGERARPSDERARPPAEHARPPAGPPPPGARQGPPPDGPRPTFRPRG
jgi:Asparagine synthase